MALFQISDSFLIRPSATNGTGALALDIDGTLLSLGGPTSSSVAGRITEVTRFESDGSVISSSVVPLQAGTATSTPTTIDVLANGNIAALYVGSTFRYQVFNPNGEALIPQTLIPLAGIDGAGTRGPWLDANSFTGGFSMIMGRDITNFSRPGDVSPGSFLSTKFGLSDVRFVELDENGYLVRQPTLINETAQLGSWIGAQEAGRHATLADGRVVIAYSDDVYRLVGTAPPGTVVGGRGVKVIVVENGVASEEVVVYNPPIDPITGDFFNDALLSPRAPVVVPTSTGGFAVLYSLDDGRWFAKFFGGDATPISGEIALLGVTGVGIDNPSPLVAMMSDGKIAIASANATGLSFGDVYLSVIDKDGPVDNIYVGRFLGGSGNYAPKQLIVGEDDSIYLSVGTTEANRVFRYVLRENVVEPDVLGVATGTNGNDAIYGDGAANQLVGRAGNDWLEGQGDNDTLLGGGGDDSLQGNAGDDSVDGGAGEDKIHGGSGNDSLLGGANDDTLTGGSGNDTIDGGDGRNTLSYERAAGGVDVILSQSGRDVGGGEGADTFFRIVDLTGSRFGDRLEGNAAANMIVGGLGNDTLLGVRANDTLDGGRGIDIAFFAGNRADAVLAVAPGGVTVTTVQGTDLLIDIEYVGFADGTFLLADLIDAPGVTRFGGDFGEYYLNSSYNDTVGGGGGNDTIEGGFGNDDISGDAGNDLLFGNEGNDVVRGGAGRDTIDGGDGNDSLIGQAQADLIRALQGNDTLNGGIGEDTLEGGIGDDFLKGGAQRDSILGDAGDDRIFGDEAADTLEGGDGDDRIDGGEGRDVIIGDAGNDTLRGGAGDDTFEFDAGMDFDRIFLFDLNEDKLQISRELAAGRTVGEIADAFVINGDGALIDFGNFDLLLLDGFLSTVGLVDVIEVI